MGPHAPWKWGPPTGALCQGQGAPWMRVLTVVAPALLLATLYFFLDTTTQDSMLRLGWQGTDGPAHWQGGGVPGSRLRPGAEVEGLRRALSCFSQGRWVRNPTPRPIPWSTRGLDVCDQRWVREHPGARAGFGTDRAAQSEAEWHVREGLKYEWQPGAECQGEWEPFGRDAFCSALRGLGGPLMVVGDALGWDMLQSIDGHLQMSEPFPRDLISTPAPCSLWEAAGKMDQSLGLCRSLVGCETPVFFVRNDRLTLDHGTPAERGPGSAAQNAEHFLPWMSLIQEWGVKAVLLSRGAHFAQTPGFAEDLAKSLKALRERYPGILVLYRATLPGHKDCGSISAPVESQQAASELPREWAEAREQNAAAKRVVEEYGGVFLDVETMAALRGDGHRGNVSEEGGGGEVDCLRYCTPGPVDGWTTLLFNALVRLTPPRPRQASPLGGRWFSCPENEQQTPVFCKYFLPYQNSANVVVQPQPTLPHALRAPPEYDVVVMVVTGILASGVVSMSDAQLNITAEMALPSGRVHVLTDSDATIAQLQRLAPTLPWGHRLRVKDVRPLLEGPRETFLAMYRHQSLHHKDYEAYCFWRWGVIHAYVQELSRSQPGVSRVFTLDADVLPSRPVSQWLPRDVDQAFGRDVTMVKLVPGAIILWTPAELGAYWSFIQGLYASQEQTEWWVRHFGQTLQAPKCAGHTDVIPCEGGMQLHASDMHALFAFLAASPDTRRSLMAGEELYRATDPAEHARILKEFSAYSCVPTEGAATFRGPWALTASDGPELTEDWRSPRGWSIILPGVDLPACFLHFHGPHAKWAMPKICSLIEERVEGSRIHLFN